VDRLRDVQKAYRVALTEKFTEPPKAFNDATLMAAMCLSWPGVACVATPSGAVRQSNLTNPGFAMCRRDRVDDWPSDAETARRPLHSSH
jgi:hypothetical protein